MDRRNLKLLNDLAFSEHPEIPRLYQKYVDRETTAYIDFRKDRNGNAKSRRFAKRGKDFVDNHDEIEVLRQYKTERDSILGLNEGAEPKKQEIANCQDPKAFDLVKNIVGCDVLEIFGDTGSGKSKFVHALALEALNSGKKVFFLDTEKNLSSADIAKLNGAYM